MIIYLANIVIWPKSFWRDLSPPLVTLKMPNFHAFLAIFVPPPVRTPNCPPCLQNPVENPVAHDIGYRLNVSLGDFLEVHFNRCLVTSIFVYFHVYSGIYIYIYRYIHIYNF